MSKEKTCEGECLFCNAKCPKCGSEAINVKLSVEYEFENDQTNHIDVFRTGDTLQLTCYDCEAKLESSDLHRDERLDPLFKALNELLDLADKVPATYDEASHKVTSQAFVSREGPKREEGD